MNSQRTVSPPFQSPHDSGTVSRPLTGGFELADGESVHVGDWLFQSDLNRLSDTDDSVHLEPRLGQLLVFLIRNAGRVVSKQDIIENVWGKSFVSDSALTRTVAQLRRALGDDAQNPRFIETIPKRGYRLLAPVAQLEEEAPVAVAAPPARRSRDRIVWAAAVLVSVLVGGFALSRQMMNPDEAPEPSRIAVLPLENLSSDSAQDYFVDGMTDALITTLARVPSLRVISRRSVEHYRDNHASLREIGESLGVDVAVEGTVLRDGHRVRITAQLTNVHTNSHLWAESYERDVKDVLALQREVAKAIALKVRSSLSPHDRSALTAAHEVDPTAHDLYLKGRYAMKRVFHGGPDHALDFFRASLDHDPTYAPAHAGIAHYYSTMAFHSRIQPRDAFPKSRQAALRALELDESLADAHRALAYVRFMADFDWASAEKAFRRALELNPSDVKTAIDYTFFLTCMGRFDEAVAMAEQAQRLDPLSKGARHWLGWVHFNARDFETALEVLSEGPQSTATHLYRAWSYTFLGRYSEALSSFRPALGENDPEDLLNNWSTYAWALGTMGREEEAREALRRVLDFAAQPGGDPYGAVIAYAGIGDLDQAFYWLDKAVEQRSPTLVYLQMEPFLDSLREDERFATYLRRVGFAAEL